MKRLLHKLCAHLMFSERVFQITFLISLLTHGIILFQNPNIDLFRLNKKEQKTEVNYLNHSDPQKYTKTITSKKEVFSKLPSKITIGKATPPPFIDKENILKERKEFISQRATFNKPAFIKPDIIAIKKKMNLPPIKNIDKINNPSYMGYYQIVREKIRRAAYQNYTRTEVGEIYLSFIISNDGYIKEARLVEEKSSLSPYLKAIALRSIKDASPFPNFPKELDYPQLSFNVVISFEIE